MEFLILGSGYTGSRVATRLRAKGLPVEETHRGQLDLLDPESMARLRVRKGVHVLYSIPAVGSLAPILDALAGKASRIVYLSTTGVYGDTKEVNETTPVAPRTERQQLRVATEGAIMAGPWSTLILRPAAIYGPGRGVHASMLDRRFALIEGGQNYISRIHVDDLAAIAEAALLSDITGAYPVADDDPCSSREIAAYCADLLGLPLPPSLPRDQVSETRRADRKVDGSAIRRLLGVTLRYPSYRSGIPAALL